MKETDVRALVVVELVPFPVPNGVNYGDNTAGFSLHEIDAEALSAQCDRFRADVFAKAGKKDPRDQEICEADE